MYCIEFYDFGQWDERANTRRRSKTEARALADEMKKRTTHEMRQAFCGHRFRVRKVKP